MSQADEEDLRARLATLRQEHRDLDTVIETLLQSNTVNSIEIQRLKKKKLVVKDQIARLVGASFPDIIA